MDSIPERPGPDHGCSNRVRYSAGRSKGSRCHSTSYEPPTQPSPRASEPGFHRPNRAPKGRGGFGVRSTFQLAHYKWDAKHIRQPVQACIEERLNFPVSCNLVWSGLMIGEIWNFVGKRFHRPTSGEDIECGSNGHPV
jgi:hypothetical protein